MPVPTETRRLTRTLAREEVYRALHAWIVDGTLAPDEQLRDLELAEQLGVSRTPVREALRRLEDEGLVRTQLNRWTRVAPIDVADAQRHFPLVWTLERLAIELSVDGFPCGLLDAMDAANGNMRAAFSCGDGDAALEANNRFHELLLARCPNAEVLRLLAEQRTRLHRFAVVYFGGPLVAQPSVGEHQAVVDALRAGDRARAAQAIETHWRRTFERQLAQLDIREAE